MLTTIIAFVLVLGILVFVHEMGHFLVARKTKTKAEEFGFGYPPRLFGWKVENGKRKFFWGNKDVKSEDTIWSVNLLPLGGFVKIKGEDGEDRDSQDSFGNKSAGKRIAILAAGVIMNVIFAMVLLMINFGIGIPSAIDSDQDAKFAQDQNIQIVQVAKDSPAKEAGVELGDNIVSINGQEIEKTNEINEIVEASEGKELNLIVDHYGEIRELKLTPVKDTDLGDEYVDEAKEGRYVIGIATLKTGVISYPWYLAIWKGFVATFVLLWRIIEVLVAIVVNLVLGRGLVTEVAGPVGVAVMTGNMVRMGISHLLQFTALLSLNLAIVNILPFPALDGGRILMIIIEKIRGKKLNEKFENAMHNIGFLLLMLLVLLVTFRDIVNFGGGIWEKIMGVVLN